MKRQKYKEKVESVLKKPFVSHAIHLYNNFRQDDLVFGLAESRDAVLTQLELRHFTHTYTNQLNQKVVGWVVGKKQPPHKLHLLDDKQLKNYYFLSRHRPYLLRRPGRPVPVHADDEDITVGAAFRRACKLLLINRAPDRTSRAHVLTDGVDWARVCDKAKSKLGVTDSELRAAFRDHKSHGKNPHIFFYDAKLNLMDEPPWEQPEIKPLFERYSREREEKCLALPSRKP